MTVIKDTKLKIDFGDGYVVNFKATGNAGGTISRGATEITFALNFDDGGLKLTEDRAVYTANEVDSSIFKCNDDGFFFTLEETGNYTINRMNVKITAENVQIQLKNYDTIIVDDINYTPLDKKLTLAIRDTGVICAGGKIQIDNAFTFDVTDGRIYYNKATVKFTCAAGTIFFLARR